MTCLKLYGAWHPSGKSGLPTQGFSSLAGFTFTNGASRLSTKEPNPMAKFVEIPTILAAVHVYVCVCVNDCT